MAHKFRRITATINTRKDQDGNTLFQVIIRLKGSPTQTAPLTRITNAKQWIQNTESAIQEGRHFKTAQAKKHTLADMIDRHVELFNPPDYKKSQLTWWKEKPARYILCDITPSLIATDRNALLQETTKRSYPRSR